MMDDKPMTDKEREIEAAWNRHQTPAFAARLIYKQDWLDTHFKNQQGICYYCKGEMILVNRIQYVRQNEGVDDWACATLDHIVPLVSDGPDTFENTCAACNGCNAAKRSFPPELFLAWCEYAIRKYNDIAERRRYIKLESAAETSRNQKPSKRK